MADDEPTTDRADGPSRPRSRSRAAAGTKRKAAASTEAGRVSKAPVRPKKTKPADTGPTDTETTDTGPTDTGPTGRAAPGKPRPAAKKSAPRPSKRTGGSTGPRTARSNSTGSTATGREGKAKADPEATKKDQRSGDPRKAAAAAEVSKRYTAPIPKEFKVSPWWVPTLLFGLLGSGMVVIFLNYLLWDARPLGLGVGLGLILGGILTATQYR